MLLSAVSVLVVAQPSLEVPEGLMNYFVFIYGFFLKIFIGLLFVYTFLITIYM